MADWNGKIEENATESGEKLTTREYDHLRSDSGHEDDDNVNWRNPTTRKSRKKSSCSILVIKVIKMSDSRELPHPKTIGFTPFFPTTSP